MPRARSLHAAELDADAALDRWLRTRRARLETIALRGTYLDEEDVRRLFGLSLPAVDELVALIELVRVARAGRFEEVIVDTAPTGHTLRLLETPDALGRAASILDDMQAKHRLMAESFGGRYRPDACDVLIEELQATASDLAAMLRDPAQVSFTLVLLPETLAIDETHDALDSLDRAGIRVGRLIVNRVTQAPDSRCALCDARRAAERAAIDGLRAGGRDVRYLPSLEREPRGLAALRPLARLLATDRGKRLVASRRRSLVAQSLPSADRPSIRREVAPVEPRGTSGASVGERGGRVALRLPAGLRLILFLGKGGVGKTTCAAAAALGLAEARPDRRVLLLSTDPAHSLGDVFDVAVGDRDAALPGGPARLRVRELDALGRFRAERARYERAADELFDALRGDSRFDATLDRRVVRHLLDLAPPGLDEVMALFAMLDALAPATDVVSGLSWTSAVAPGFSRTNGEAPATGVAFGFSRTNAEPASEPYDLVILDTAPTGHALRLLAMPAAAHVWTQALLSLLRKYGGAARAAALAEAAVRLARGLRQLRALLADPRRARAIVVTRPAHVPLAETRRVLAAARHLGLRIHAAFVNAATPRGCARCTRIHRVEQRIIREVRRAVRRTRPRCGIIVAPAVAPPPRGVGRLLSWSDEWQEEKLIN